MKQNKKKTTKKKVARSMSKGGTLLAGSGRAKIHDNTTMLNKKARQEWKQKFQGEL